MDKKYIRYFKDMLNHIKRGSELSKKSKEVGKKYNVCHDLIYYAGVAGYISRIGIGKYKVNVDELTERDIQLVLDTRKAKLSKKPLPVIQAFTPKPDTTIVVGQTYHHPHLGRVNVLEIESRASVYVKTMNNDRTLFNRVHSRLLTSDNQLELDLDDMKLSTRNMSVRTANCLNSVNIKTVNELASHPRSYYLGLKNTGNRTLHEIENILASHNLNFAYEPELLRVKTPQYYKRKQRDADIISQVESGKKIADIAKSFKVNKSVISLTAKKYGIIISSHRKAERDKVTLDIKSDLKEGLTENELKAKYNSLELKRNSEFIKTYFSKLESKNRMRKRDDKLITLYKAGFTMKELSTEFNLGLDSIAKTIRRNKAYKYPELGISVSDKREKTKTVKDFIFMLRNECKLPIGDIVNELEVNGYRTLRGTKYTEGSVYAIIYDKNNSDYSVKKNTKAVREKKEKFDNNYLNSYTKRFKKATTR